MRRRTPQEKKKLSLQNDRRNVYGESPHGARTSIPLNKKLRNRANRHQQDSKLVVVPKQVDEDEADEIESSVRRKAPKQWKKFRDAPLANVIAGNHERRIHDQGRKLRSKATRFFRDGRFSGACPTCRSDVYILVGRRGSERYGVFCAVGHGLPNPTFSKVEIRSCRSSELPEIARRLYSLCIDSGDRMLGDWLCRLFGISTCPQCRNSLSIAKAVAASKGLRGLYSTSGPVIPSPPEWFSHLSNWLYLQR